MKKFSIAIVVACLMALTGGSALADIVSVTFDFNTLGNGADSSQISDYMTSVWTNAGYTGSITVSDATARRDTSGSRDWPGNESTYIWTNGRNERDFEILFPSAIVGISGDTRCFVFDSTNGDDFTIRAYGSTYGDDVWNPGWWGGGSWTYYDVERPNPGAEVYDTGWTVRSDKREVDVPDISFSDAVLLLFSNDGEHDVAIDNLTVQIYVAPQDPEDPNPVVPVPGAVLLGVLGLGAAGMRLRKNKVA